MIEYIFTILLDIPADYDALFNEVYDTDHLLNMVRIPGVKDCTRYKLEWSDNADMLTYLALYRMDELDLPRSDVWKKHAAMGRWPTDVRPHVTVRRNGVFRRIFHADAPGAAATDNSTDSDFIYFLLQSIPAELDIKFNHLYNTNHIPLMLQTAGAASCTRYKLQYSESGDVPDYLAIYAVDGINRPRSSEWKVQTNLGAWPTEIRPHFTARRNGVFRRTGVFKAQ
jgi:hypothetical protein